MAKAASKMRNMVKSLSMSNVSNLTNSRNWDLKIFLSVQGSVPLTQWQGNSQLGNITHKNKIGNTITELETSKLFHFELRNNARNIKSTLGIVDREVSKLKDMFPR